MSDVVARELAALVAHKLAETKADLPAETQIEEALTLGMSRPRAGIHRSLSPAVNNTPRRISSRNAVTNSFAGGFFFHASDRRHCRSVRAACSAAI